MDEHRLYSAVLAAGEARRFGGVKQLACYRGEALVRHAWRRALELTGKRSLLVLGAQWREVLQACEPLDGFFAVNGRFAEGMGTSIALAGALLRPVADGMLILLADQPLIVESHLRQLQARWLQEPSGIVATRFGGVSGPPVIFPGRCIAALCELDGDRGAREILQREVSSCISIRFEDAATDIDTREDLQRLQ